MYLALLKLVTLYRLFREYYVLWNVAIGARGDRRSISTRARLHAYVCKTSLLDQVSVNQIYSFLISMIDSDVTVTQFHKVILSYTYVILCRERTDGSLRGAMMLGINHREQDGKKYTLVRLGLAFTQRNYQGGPLLYYVVLYHVLKELLCHPFTPIYIVGKAFSYKSYLIMTKIFQSMYPRYDTTVPPFEQKLIDNFAEEVRMEGDVYDPKRCVIERTISSTKEFVAPISAQELKNPHIKFFQETNPGWQQGHQLVTLGKVTWRDIAKSLYRAVTRARTTRHEGITRRDLRKLSRERGMSFQSEEACTYARKYSEGGTLLPIVDESVTLDEELTVRNRPLYATQASFDVKMHL